MVAAGVRERTGVQVRESFRHRVAELALRERAFGEELPGEVEHRLEVEPRERRPEVAVCRQLLVEHRLHQRPELQAVVGGDEVQRAAHHHDAHDCTVEHQLRELFGAEPDES